MSDDHRTTTGLLSFERIGQFNHLSPRKTPATMSAPKVAESSPSLKWSAFSRRNRPAL